MATDSKPEVVVVTGASAGVGRATAQAFAKRGARVGLIARGRAGLEGAKNEVESFGGKAMVLPADVADADAVEEGFAFACLAPGIGDLAHGADSFGFRHVG